jgi:sulfofructose kinase
MDVLCIGLAGYDLVFPLPEFPREDGKYEAGALYASGGGPAANAAYLLSRWGAACGLACVLGRDAWGDRVRAEFKAAGTDLRFSRVGPGDATPLSSIWVNRANGSRTIVNHRARGEPLHIDLTDAGSRLEPKLLLMDGHEPEASLEAMDAWPRAVTVLDAGSRRRGTEMLASEVDYLVASAHFASAMTDVSPLGSRNEREECLRRLLALNGRQVAVTLGEKGLIYLDQGREGRRLSSLAAPRVQALDTTGAGDIFHGAFAHGLVAGKPFAEALRFAAAAAALSVTRPGGRGSIPELAEVEAAGGRGKKPC